MRRFARCGEESGDVAAATRRQSRDAASRSSPQRRRPTVVETLEPLSHAGGADPEGAFWMDLSRINCPAVSIAVSLHARVHACPLGLRPLNHAGAATPR